MILVKKGPVRRIVSVVLTLSMICTLLCVGTVPTSAASYDLLNPISGTVQGTGYDESAGHYGIDLYPYNYGDPVYAVSSGTLMYSCERNHTKEYQTGDDCCTVKIILDEPITYNGMTYVCAFYTHMSSLVYDVYCGYKDACVAEYNAGMRTNALPTESVHVNAGDLIGYVGKGNGATHLHFSFEASEADGYAMMPNSEYYNVFDWEYNDTIVAISNNNAIEYLSSNQRASFNPLWPCDAYYVTCLYYYSSGSKHSATYWDKAIDIAKNGDVNIYAIEAGTVTYSGWSSGGLGYKVMIKHNNGHTSIYGHLKNKPLVSEGASVTRGQVIGKMGGTGGYGASAGTISYGQHLHFEYSGADLWDTVWKESLKSTLTYESNCYSNNYRNGTYNGNDSKSRNIVSWLSANYTKNSSGIYTYNGSHSHSYSIIEYEAAHPHKAYTRCPCGKIGDYTGATTSVANCSSCTGTCNCSSSYAGTYKCVTSVAPLTIRDGHSTSSKAIGSIPPGATVTVTKGNGSWAHVTYNGIVGYASMEYLTLPLQQSSAYPVPFKGYPLSDAQHAANAYDAVNGNEIGYIYGSDYCTIKAVYDNGWCLVNCPWNGGTKDVYTWTAFFLNMTCSPYTEVVQAQADTYTRLGSTSTLGWVDKGDHVTIVDNTSARAQIIYPHTDGTYRCAWVDYHPAFTHVHTPGAVATCTSPQVCTTCDAIITPVQSHTPGSAATCVSDQICTICGLTLKPRIAHTPGTAATCITPQLCTACNTVLAGTVEHKYTAGDYVDPVHPHKIYNTCGCGATRDSGQTSIVSSCEICNPPVTYEITFVTNGGSPTILPHYKKQGETITLSSLTKNGYSFLGWDTDSSADTAVYKAGAVYTVTGNATLYAVWKQDAVNVTGISLNKTSLTVDVGDTVTLTATVTPSNATNKAVSWSSTNTSVATVTNGIVNTLKAGTAKITATTADGNYKADCIVTVNEKNIVTNATVTFGNVSGKPGDIVEVEIFVTTSVPITTIGVSDINVSNNNLTFIGFVEPKDYTEYYSSPFLFSSYDNDKQIITLGMNGASIFSGSIGKIKMKISDSAEEGAVSISGTVKILNGSDVLPCKIETSTVTVRKQLLGDINLDDYVDIDDALLLFQNSLYPEYYPIDYIGNLDFTKDGFVDIDDALLLFQYSLYPDYYPIN